jgi:hypothetical protein
VSYADDNIHFLGFPSTSPTRIYPLKAVHEHLQQEIARSRLFPSSRPEWRSHGAERSRLKLSRSLDFSIPLKAVHESLQQEFTRSRLSMKVYNKNLPAQGCP